MTGAPVVRIDGLSKSFRVQRSWRDVILRPRERDVRRALDHVDLEVGRGEFFGILGQNGAGKTTLFKVLATLVEPDEGRASVAGCDVVGDPLGVRRALVPVLASERSLYWRISATENLRLYASLYGMSGSSARRRIDEALRVVGLDGVGGKQVGLFSSGMKQRLLIARALLGKPEVLLLDEPTRSLDPVSAREFRAFLRREIGGEQGITVLLASHDQEEVTELCDRVAVLDAGRVLAVGATEALLASAGLKVVSLWTDAPSHPALGDAVAAAGGRVTGIEAVPLNDGAGWFRVRLELPADEAGVARTLAAVVAAGVPVSRFEREGRSLADLLDRVRALAEGGAGTPR